MARYYVPPNVELFRNQDEQATFDYGATALRRIRNDAAFDDWMAVLEAYRVCMKRAVEMHGPWHRNNKKAIWMANGLFGEFEKRWGDLAGSNQKPLSPNELSALRKIIEDPNVLAWRNTLDGPRRRNLNAPRSLVNAFKRATTTPDEETVEQQATKEEVTIELQKKLIDTEKRLKHLQNAAVWDAPENLAKAAQVLRTYLGKVSMSERVECLLGLAADVGITDLTRKLVAPARRRRNVGSRR